MSRFQIHDVVTLSAAGERIVHKTASEYGTGYVVEVAEWDGPPVSATVYYVEWYSPRSFQRRIFRETELRAIRREDTELERNPLLDVAAYGPVGYEKGHQFWTDEQERLPEADSHADAYPEDRDYTVGTHPVLAACDDNTCRNSTHTSLDCYAAYVSMEYEGPNGPEIMSRDEWERV